MEADFDGAEVKNKWLAALGVTVVCMTGTIGMAEEDVPVVVASSDLRPDPVDLIGGAFAYREDRAIGYVSCAACEVKTEVAFAVIQDTGFGDELRNDQSQVTVLQPWPCYPDVCQSSVDIDADSLTARVSVNDVNGPYVKITYFSKGLRGIITSDAASLEIASHNAETALVRLVEVLKGQ